MTTLIVIFGLIFFIFFPALWTFLLREYNERSRISYFTERVLKPGQRLRGKETFMGPFFLRKTLKKHEFIESLVFPDLIEALKELEEENFQKYSKRNKKSLIILKSQCLNALQKRGYKP